MNTVILSGWVAKDFELKTLAGKTFCEYELGVGGALYNSATKSTGTGYIKCKCWEKTAEFAYNNLRKGTKVLVSGKLGMTSWINKDGKTVSEPSLTVNQHELLDGKPSQPKPTGTVDLTEQKQEQVAFMDLSSGDVDNLPFV